MTTEQSKALEVVKEIESQQQGILWKLAVISEDDSGGKKERAKRQGEYEALENTFNLIAELKDKIETSFGVGWILEAEESFPYETPEFKVPMVVVCRKFNRVDGETKVKYETRMDAGYEFHPINNAPSGIIEFQKVQ